MQLRKLIGLALLSATAVITAANAYSGAKAGPRTDAGNCGDPNQIVTTPMVTADVSKTGKEGAPALSVDVVTYLPLGYKQVCSVHYFSTAEKAGDVPLREVPPGELAWSRIDAYQIKPEPTSYKVWFTFSNWSHNRRRSAGIVVDYIP